MIYLFSGDDSVKKIASYEKFIASLKKGEETFFINKNDFDESQIESLYSGQGLFFEKCTVVLQNTFESSAAKEFLIKRLPEMKDSINDFVFLEGKLLKSVLDAFKKAEAKINNFELSHAQKERFNNFLLANAFGVRDKLNLWVYYRQAMDLGVGMEELVGVLFWKIKDMILKRQFVKFKEDELKNIGAKLAYLLPEARREGRDAEAVFEAFLLEAI